MTLLCVFLFVAFIRFFNILNAISVSDILSQSVIYLLILLTVSFTEQKFFILMKFELPIFFLHNHAFSDVVKSHCESQGHLDFLF